MAEKELKGENILAKDGHTYHKSATANATTAPTNEATIEKAQGKHLTPEQLDLVTVLDYEWNLKGELSAETIERDYGFENLDQLLADEVVQQALEERGVKYKQLLPVGDTDGYTPSARLNPIQLIAANRLLDLTDTRSNKKKLQDLGVSSLQYNAWLRDPEFTNYLRSRAESLLGDTQHEALLALMDKAHSGDTKAIELYLEITGRHVKQTAANVNGGADINSILVRVIEIIIDECDADTAQRIGVKLKALAAGQQFASMMTGESAIVTPEIAVGRELTPEVKELMNRGVGYDG